MLTALATPRSQRRASTLSRTGSSMTPTVRQPALPTGENRQARCRRRLSPPGWRNWRAPCSLWTHARQIGTARPRTPWAVDPAPIPPEPTRQTLPQDRSTASLCQQVQAQPARSTCPAPPPTSRRPRDPRESSVTQSRTGDARPNGQRDRQRRPPHSVRLETAPPSPIPQAANHPQSAPLSTWSPTLRPNPSPRHRRWMRADGSVPLDASLVRR
jgi:hypothetical protein